MRSRASARRDLGAIQAREAILPQEIRREAFILVAGIGFSPIRDPLGEVELILASIRSPGSYVRAHNLSVVHVARLINEPWHAHRSNIGVSSDSHHRSAGIAQRWACRRDILRLCRAGLDAFFLSFNNRRNITDVLTWHLRFVPELKLSEVYKELERDVLFNSLNRIELDRYW